MPRGSRLRVLGGRVRQPHPTVASEALSASVSARPCPRAAYSFVSPVVSPARATTTTLCGVHARCRDIVAVCTHLALWGDPRCLKWPGRGVPLLRFFSQLQLAAAVAPWELSGAKDASRQFEVMSTASRGRGQSAWP